MAPTARRGTRHARKINPRPDNPTATKFTVHILAAVAEFISKRTREALAAAKAGGVKLGDYQRMAKAKQAKARYETVRKPPVGQCGGDRSQPARHYDCSRWRVASRAGPACQASAWALRRG